MIDVSDSQLKEFARCPRRWGYTRLLKLDPAEDKDSLIFGNAVHKGLDCLSKGMPFSQAILAAIEEVKKGKPEDLQRQLIVVPALLEGFVKFFLPGFLAEYEYVKTEEWFEYNPSPTVKYRGFIDIIARSRKTGKAWVWDYKTSSTTYARELTESLSYNHQLAIYAIAYRRIYGEWPEGVGLIFLSKPKHKEATTAAEAARTEKGLYTSVFQQVTPQFAQFAMEVETSDVVWAGLMAHYKELFVRLGCDAFAHIPPNFNNCKSYGSLCGFAGGCHKSKPAHTVIAQAKRATA